MKSSTRPQKRESASSKLYKAQLGNIYDDTCSLCRSHIKSWNTDRRMTDEQRCGMCKDEHIDPKTTELPVDTLQNEGVCDFCQRYFCRHHQDLPDEKGRATGMCKKCRGFSDYRFRKLRDIPDFWARARRQHLQTHEEIDTVKNCLTSRWVYSENI